MKKNNFWIVGALVCVLAFVVALTACGGTNNAAESATDEAEATVAAEEDLGEAVETDDMFDSYIEKDPDEIDFPGEGEYGESDSLDF